MRTKVGQRPTILLPSNIAAPTPWPACLPEAMERTMPTISPCLSLQVRRVMACQQLPSFGHPKNRPKGMSLYVRTVSYGVLVCPTFARIQNHRKETGVTQKGLLSSPHVPTTEMYGSQHQQNTTHRPANAGGETDRTTDRASHEVPLGGQRKSTS